MFVHTGRLFATGLHYGLIRHCWELQISRHTMFCVCEREQGGWGLGVGGVIGVACLLYVLDVFAIFNMSMKEWLLKEHSRTVGPTTVWECNSL